MSPHFVNKKLLAHLDLAFNNTSLTSFQMKPLQKISDKCITKTCTCSILQFSEKNNCETFLIFARNVDRGYTLEPPSGCPPSVFWSGNGREVYPCKLLFLYKGVFVTRTCFRDVKGAAGSTWLRVNFKK